MHARLLRLAASALALAGVFFVLYPLVRPFSDEASMRGAAAFGSDAWIVAHVLAMCAFILMTTGVLVLGGLLTRALGGSLSQWAVALTWVGVGLTLPFYGAEAFALNPIGREALRTQSTAVLALANEVRNGPGLLMFLAGLGAVAIGAVALAVAIWKAGALPKWSGIPFALGFVLYIPQFFWQQPLRVGHGLLVSIGCAWIALGMWRAARVGR